MLVIEIALGVLIGLLAFVFLHKKYEANKIKNEQKQAEFVKIIRQYKEDLEFVESIISVKRTIKS